MNCLLLTIFAAIALLSCDNQTSTSTAATKNEKIVRQFYEYFNKHEWDKMAELYTDVADFKDPSLGQGIIKQTRQQTIKKYSELSAMFPNVKDKILQMYSSGEKHVIVEFVSAGTAPDSTKFELPICTIFTIENGKITKDFTYYNNFENPKP